MDHGLAEIFSAGLPLRTPNGDRVSGPIVFNNDRVVNGYDVRALLKILYRIPACVHDLAQKSIRPYDRPLGIIHKLGLNGSPPVRKIGACSCRKWINPK